MIKKSFAFVFHLTIGRLWQTRDHPSIIVANRRDDPKALDR